MTLTHHKDFVIELSCGPVTFVQEGHKGVMLPHAPSVVIDNRHHGADELDTWIHETLHIALPKAGEAEVARISGDIARVLWRAGYRRKGGLC